MYARARAREAGAMAIFVTDFDKHLIFLDFSGYHHCNLLVTSNLNGNPVPDG